MKAQTENSVSLSEWLAEYEETVALIQRSGTDLDDIVEDHARLTEAIRYWSGRSEERVEEFRGMALELERELSELVEPMLASSRGKDGDRAMATPVGEEQR